MRVFRLFVNRQFLTAIFLTAALSVNVLADKTDKPVAVTEKDKDGKVTIAKGKELAVSLEITTGTGYTWQVGKVDKKQLEQLGEPKTEKPENGRLGAKAQQVFKFKALSAGTSTLELNYLRPFEKEKKPPKTFAIKVTV